jgi:vacuolar-type H+-ATPase subunit B/Vma2
VLDFTDRFEAEFVGQGAADRNIEETLVLALDLLVTMPIELLKRIPQHVLDKYYGQ